jgi:hypothetical protein
MSETCILIGLLWLYFPQNWELGSALSKLRKFWRKAILGDNKRNKLPSTQVSVKYSIQKILNNRMTIINLVLASQA